MHNYLNPSLNHHISIYCINHYKNKPSSIIGMFTAYPNTRYIVYWSSQISFTLKSFRNLILSPHMLVYSLNSKERNLLTITPNSPEFSPVTLHNAFFSNVTRTSSPLMRRLAAPKSRQAFHTSSTPSPIFQHSQCSRLSQIHFSLSLTWFHFHTTTKILILITLTSIPHQHNSLRRSSLFSRYKSSWTLNSNSIKINVLIPQLQIFTDDNP